MRSVFSVTMYWCSTAQTGTRMPTIAAISRPHMPVALITNSASMLPASVITVVTRRPRRAMPVTRTPWSSERPPRPGTGRVGHRQAGRIHVAVAFDPGGAFDAFRLEQRKKLACLRRGNELDLKAEALRHRRRALELEPARGRRGEAQAPDTLPPRCLARFGFELAVQLRAVAHQAREIAAAAKLPDQSRRVPRRAVRELQALEQHDVANAALREVIRDAAADDAAADDDDPAFRWHVHRGANLAYRRGPRLRKFIALRMASRARPDGVRAQRRVAAKSAIRLAPCHTRGLPPGGLFGPHGSGRSKRRRQHG
jgi:hypothetical protein